MEKNKIISNLVDELLLNKESYYNTGDSMIPDWLFDANEKMLLELDPEFNHPKTRDYFQIVGSVASDADIKHDTPMLSMAKTNTKEEFNKWVKLTGLTKTDTIIIEPKVDGISATCKYDKDGKLVYVATRGDGKEGSKIKFGRMINNIPRTIPSQFGGNEIRGELYIPQHLKSSIKELETRPLRNYCSGILKRDNVSKEIDLVHFVAYDIVPYEGINSVQKLFKMLKTMKFDAVGFKVCKITDVFDYMHTYTSTLRDKLPYETDGIIVTIDDMSKYQEIDSKKVVTKYHHYNTAIKPPAKGENTVINSVKWEVSAYGRIKPVGMLQPVEVGDVTISNVTLVNAEYLKNLGIGSGDIVRIERANDVIPKLIGVEKKRSKKNFSIPTKCPSCGSILEKSGLEIVCTNRFCKDRVISWIENWVMANDIKDVGRKIIEDLYNNDIIQTISDLYRKDLGDCMSIIPGYVSDGKKISKIVKAINDSKDITELELLANIGIPGVRESTLKNLGIFGVKDLLHVIHRNDILRFASAQSIKSWIEDEYNLEELESLVKVMHPKKPVKKTTPKGRVCITGSIPGVSRNELIKRLSKRNFDTVNTVTKGLEYLIVGEGSEGKSKYKKALLLNIPTLHYSKIDEILK